MVAGGITVAFDNDVETAHESTYSDTPSTSETERFSLKTPTKRFDSFRNDASQAEKPSMYSKSTFSVKSSAVKDDELVPNDLFKGANMLTPDVAASTNLQKSDSLKRIKQSYVDEIFERYDDMFANYIPDNGFVTPRLKTRNNTYRTHRENVPSPEKYVSSAEKAARCQDFLDEQNEICEVFLNSGVKSVKSLSKLCSGSKKRQNKEFECSTPINNNMAMTPVLNESKRINTPLSGIRCLESPGDFLSNLLKSSNPTTPTISKGNHSLDGVHPSTKFHRVIDIPEAETATVLMGVTCYVEVRSGKENRSEPVKKELLLLGAKVEKNFTRKVMVVVFKEGLVSTYLKAKDWGVTMVSILWIEACKFARGQVDPTLYPPVKMRKYDGILPFQTLKKRRLRLPKKENADPCSPSLISYKRNGRNVITEAKLVPQNNVGDKLSKSRVCTKKLIFGNIDENELKKESVLKDLSSNSLFNGDLNGFARRDSAPGCLPTQTKIRQRRLFNFESTCDNKLVRPNLPDRSRELPKLIANEGVTEIMESKGNNNNKKKMKLFDPSLTYFSQNSTNEVNNVSIPLPESYMNIDSKIVKMTTSNQKVDKQLIDKASVKTKLTMLNKLTEDCDTSLTRRSSLTLFVTSKRTPPSKLRPTIVFTSISRSDLGPYEEMVKQLGIFELEAKVSNRTSHVISKGARRTMNLLKGLVRGCWLVDLEWIVKSNATGTWIPEEEYELTGFSPAVTQCRMEKQAFGKEYSMDLLSSCGPIYISNFTKVPRLDLLELVRLCKGKVVTQASVADILIGGKENKVPPKVRIKESWILDSITQNTVLDTKYYIC